MLQLKSEVDHLCGLFKSRTSKHGQLLPEMDFVGAVKIEKADQ